MSAVPKEIADIDADTPDEGYLACPVCQSGHLVVWCSGFSSIRPQVEQLACTDCEPAVVWDLRFGWLREPRRHAVEFDDGQAEVSASGTVH